MSDDPGASNRPDPPPDERSPFERFEDVLRRVTAVPKSAVDGERERHRNRR